MSLKILPSETFFIYKNNTLQLGASGGTGPYTFSLLNSEHLGSITSGGLYSAPNYVTENIVQVEDSLGSIAQATIYICGILELISNIIKSEMDLDNGQVYLYNQKVNIPTDEKIYISVGELGQRVFGFQKQFDPSGKSIQAVNVQKIISVDIFSRSMDALNRKEEVIMSLFSDYSENMQTINSFFIARQPLNFNNISYEDGAAMLYKFNISFNVLCKETKTSNTSYFDNFSEVEILKN